MINVNDVLASANAKGTTPAVRNTSPVMIAVCGGILSDRRPLIGMMNIANSIDGMSAMPASKGVMFCTI